MCGIAGYVGAKNAVEVVVSQLKNMEYRGYDSAGVAAIEDGKICLKKTVGRVSALEEIIGASDFGKKANCAIGHTRWATHGEPLERNAHPHGTDRMALVHNGIIENHLELKSRLKEQGATFVGETDTEVAVKLLDYNYDGDPVLAIQKTIKELRGSYTFAILFHDFADKLFLVKKESPLLIGISDGESFVASDLNAIVCYTNRYIMLENDEIAIVESGLVTVLDKNSNKIEKPEKYADWSSAVCDKFGFEHFMLKEISEQPEIVLNLISKNIENGLPKIDLDMNLFNGINRILIVACGSAMYAGLAGKYWIERFAKLPVEIEVASEFRYRSPVLNSETLVVVISQSGETADTLAALRLAKSHGVKTLGIVNMAHSSIGGEVEYLIPTEAGTEVAVASTKSYMAQICVLFLLGLQLGIYRDKLEKQVARELCNDLLTIPKKLKHIIDNQIIEVEKLAKVCAKFDDVFFVGRGLDYVSSLEGAIKLKELAYINAQSYAAGELKHGPISLITKETLTIALVSQSKLSEKTLSNILEIKARGGQVALILQSGLQIDQEGEHTIEIERMNDEIMPFLVTVILQLLAYYTAIERGNDVDRPRNLAKSVTVE